MPKSKRCRVCGSSELYLHSPRNPAGWSKNFRKQLQELYPSIFPSKLAGSHCVLCCEHFEKHQHKKNGKTAKPHLLALRQTAEVNYEPSGGGKKCALCRNTRDTVRLHKPPDGGWSEHDLSLLKDVSNLPELPPKNALLCCHHFEPHEDKAGNRKRAKLVIKTTMATIEHTRTISSPSNIARRKRMRGATSFAVRQKRTREERSGLARQEKKRKMEEKRREAFEKMDKSRLIQRLLEMTKAEPQRSGLGMMFNDLPDSIHSSQYGFSSMDAFTAFNSSVSQYQRAPQPRSTNKYSPDLALKVTMLMLRKGDSITHLYYMLPSQYQAPSKIGRLQPIRCSD